MARMPPFHVDGHMAMERPRNFKLELDHRGVTKADIGSNADEFWYWIANPKEPYVFWCQYDELESSSLSVTYQPDWIIEALGLKPIPPEEAAMIRVRNGTEPGTTVLAFPAVRNHGEPYSREMIVSNGDRRIKKLRIYGEKPRSLIAEAQPSTYQAYPDRHGRDVGCERRATSRRSCKLDWKREQLVLDVALDRQKVKVNQFEHARGEEIFIEPAMEGYTRLNLAELSRGSRPAGRTMTQGVDAAAGFPRHPAGPSRALAGLGDPLEPNVSRARARSESDGEADDRPLPTLDELVGAPVGAAAQLRAAATAGVLDGAAAGYRRSSSEAAPMIGPIDAAQAAGIGV